MGGAEGCCCHDGAVLFCRRLGVESVSLEAWDEMISMCSR